MTDYEGVLTGYGELLRIIELLPDLVHEKRRRRQLSLRSAAKEVGVSLNTIRRCEQREGDLQTVHLKMLIQWVST